ncbi:hypothetical protein STCU_10282 [Strigomonas culicis]|uniref:Uncharacterized protein n=1 Tax=Strigomonas culicis TaxID=28005 RepID=S9TMG4_9TRYP|nr:hypothetical protein STCU_10282 [Strigomonas culicis]|eukprot:EPY17969.1 hypothetical protein STCU_10282 [Strigomonas culicis]
MHIKTALFLLLNVNGAAALSCSILIFINVFFIYYLLFVGNNKNKRRLKTRNCRDATRGSVTEKNSTPEKKKKVFIFLFHCKFCIFFFFNSAVD